MLDIPLHAGFLYAQLSRIRYHIPASDIYSDIMKSSYRIGNIWGIPLNIHISLLFLVGYLCLQAFRVGFQTYGVWFALFAVVSVALILTLSFTCIGLHELGHCFIAMRKGCKVREITLMIAGGAAIMENIPKRPKDEFAMAIAGPAVSATLAIAFGLLAAPFAVESWIGLFFRVLAWGNGILAMFNLLPAFPMDGGRIARALLTTRFGRLRATRIAMLLGRGFAITFGLTGILHIMQIMEWLTPHTSFILIIIAGFIYIMGNREYRQVQIETLMQQRGFSSLFGSTGREEFHEIPPDDETVVISPPPYRRGPADYAHIEKESHDRFSFFR